MKNVCLKIGLIALALALVFGVAIVVLSIKKEYAEDHYSRSYKENEQYGESPILGRVYLGTLTGYGCGEKDCKYCDGIYYASRYSSFIYYRTIRGFLVASIVLTAVCGVTSCVTIPLHFKHAKTRRSDREDY